jgi:glycosyltransferase involved in cell wall biosynthesis
MPLFSTGVSRSLLVIHDLLFWRFPSELTFLKRATRYFFLSQALKKAELIVAVSEFTKKELQEFGCRKSIGVCLEGVDPIQKNVAISELRFPVDKPYFLFIGAHSFQKNLPELVVAFDGVKRAGLDCRLILAGGKGTATQSVLDAVRASTFSSDIILPGFVSDVEKDWLMRNAIAFVFPSIYEGFGIPLLEAFQRNVPVITSDRASLPEVAGEGALISKPDHKSLSAAMLELAENGGLREELIQKGADRLQNFQWDLVAENILNSIQQK